MAGVAWAMPYYLGQGRLKLGDGNYQQVLLVGVDDATLVGAPREMVLGRVLDLRQPDAVFMDERGYRYLWPDQPLDVGKLLEMNDHRLILTGVCLASDTYQSFRSSMPGIALRSSWYPRPGRRCPAAWWGSDPASPARKSVVGSRRRPVCKAVTRARVLSG